MRGHDTPQAGMFSYLSPEARVPVSHPLRPIRHYVDTALTALSPQLERLYARTGRPSIAPEKLLRAENETLRKENARLSTLLKQAELIIDVQKKSHRSWASCWRRPRKAGTPDGRHTVTVYGDRHQASL